MIRFALKYHENEQILTHWRGVSSLKNHRLILSRIFERVRVRLVIYLLVLNLYIQYISYAYVQDLETKINILDF